MKRVSPAWEKPGLSPGFRRSGVLSQRRRYPFCFRLSLPGRTPCDAEASLTHEGSLVFNGNRIDNGTACHVLSG